MHRTEALVEHAFAESNRAPLWPVRNAFERARSSDPPVYFLLHIPKTAGQTIRRHLGEYCSPGAFWEPGSTTGRRAGSRVPHEMRFVRAVSGRDLGCSLENLFPGREIRRIVLLREPVSLRLSLYNYRMMNYLARGQGTYSFALHLQVLPRDFVAHRLLSSWLEIPWPALMAMANAQKYELLNRALANFWFVGDYADCGLLIEAIARDLEIPRSATPRNTSREWQRQVEWRALRADELSAAARETILMHNPIDRALWESWHAAGFNAANTAPHSLSAGRRSSFFVHELIRPGYEAARLLLRHRTALGRGKGGGTARADRARDSGDWMLAARYYREALARMPNTPAVWVQYGHGLKETGKPAEAEAAYRRSLVLDPDTADTHLQLGHALKLQGRIDEAAQAYLRALTLDRSLGHAHSELAGLGWTAERIEQALPPPI